MKLFKIFKWQNFGEGQTQTYLMAESSEDAILQFGEDEGIEPWYGYGAKETTMSDIDSEIQDLYIEYQKIKTRYYDLLEIYEELEERLDKS